MNIPYSNKKLVLFLLIFFTYGCCSQKTPTAKNGTMDLSSYDFKQGAVGLNGEWTFYWKQLINPDDLKKNEYRKKLTSVPSLWNVKKGKGYATYVLDINLKESGEPLGLMIPEMASAYRLWINNILSAQNGIVGTDKKSSKPQFLPKTVYIVPDSKSFRLVLQISNFDDYEGGVWNSITLGLKRQIELKHFSRVFINAFMLGILFIMALYHLTLFLLKKEFYPSLFFSLFCMIAGIRLYLMGERFIILMFPFFNWETAARLEHITLYMTVPLFILYTASLYPNEVDKKAAALIILFSTAAIIITAILPIRSSSFVLVPYLMMTCIASIYGLIVYLFALIRKKEGAAIIGAGYTLFIATAINDILCDRGIISSAFIMPYGFIIMIFAQAFVQSYRFTNAFTRSEKLTKELNEITKNQKQLLQKYENSRYINLQKRMDPHFLFNSLHTICILMNKDKTKAEKSLFFLSGIYQFLLEKSFRQLISFEDEWTFTQNFLDLKKIELSEKLLYDIKVEGNLMKVQIPPLTLQPIVENSIKHGLRGVNKGKITVRAVLNEPVFTLTVEDNGTGFQKADIFEGTLGNIKNRLLYFYKDLEFICENRVQGAATIISFNTGIQ